MIAVAGRVADGTAMGVLLSPGYIRDTAKPRFEAAAVEAGRDPSLLGATVPPFVSVDEDAEVARQAAHEAIYRLFSPPPYSYYDFLLREQGFSKAADAARRYMQEGKKEKAMEAFTDDVLDKVAISGSVEHCRKQLERSEGVANQTLFVNVNYSETLPEALISAFRWLIEIGRKEPS